jgi:Flp pilus assembly pilin Flp
MKKSSRIRYRSGVSLLEYAGLVAMVATALLAMFFVIQRGVSGNWKQSADVFGHGQVYQP